MAATRSLTATPVAQPTQRGVGQTHVVDAGAFTPTNPAATRKLQFLLQRGGLVLAASASVVRVLHAGRSVSIDARGRVRWAA